MFGRIAFAVFLLRLIGKTSNWQRLVLQIMIPLQVAGTIVVIVQLLAHCGSHITDLWLAKGSTILAHCESFEVGLDLGYLLTGLKHNISLIVLSLTKL